jgi:hypothetical protein
MNWTENATYNNCYSYAFRDYDPDATRKRIPGNSSLPYTCEKLIDGVLRDRPEVTFRSSKHGPCPDGHYKVFLAVDERKTTNDFHFWRHECDGMCSSPSNRMWTHKPGSKYPSDRDGSNRKISDPENSDKHVGKYQYDKNCGYFCVPK